jgi:SpoVK/Ycf46/Vps4 family AAA+-type ATPase
LEFDIDAQFTFLQVRKASAEETPMPGVSDEEIEAQIIEDSLCPPDDAVEMALSRIIGLEAVKNQVRGLRRTMEKERVAGTGGAKSIPRHLTFVGNPGTGKTTVAHALANIFFEIGVMKTRNIVEVGREDLIDHKSEARTVFKTRKVLERAMGGVLLLQEAYTLLPSTARPRGRDHGAAALRELARAFPSGDPLVILTGAPLDLQRVLSSDIGFKGHFLTRIEFPDQTPMQIARIFMSKLKEKGLVAAEGVTVEYLAGLITSNTDPEWRTERNGRIADLLMVGVRAELKKRTIWDDAASKGSLSPMKILSPGSSRMPAFAPEEVFVTVEDIQNSIVNGM